MPSEPPDPPHVRADGEAIVTAKPDRAKIDIGLVSQAQTARLAAEQNSKQLNEVISDIRKTLGSEVEIRTISYSLSPQQRYPKDGGQPVIVGFKATNIVQVTTDDLSTVGKIIDIATQAGANNIQGMQFTLRDEEAVRAQALRQATLEARASAEAIAAALGVKIVRVLSVVEGEHPPVRPVFNVAMARAAQSGAPPTPVEPGTIEIHAKVTLTAEISQ
jgi:uncharacterized protein YggE